MARSDKIVKLFNGSVHLPFADNTPQALNVYRAANERFRQIEWPQPFDNEPISSRWATPGTCPVYRISLRILS
jgi:hypothetical protein